jgi:catechol 2,3-dioxygenase-like lactoylglutathione lyase family enzyme
MRLTGVVIGASDLDAARERYGALLATTPRPLDGGGWRFALAPGAVDLVAGTPGLQAVRFAVEPGTAAPADFHGIDVRLEAGTHAEAAVDHGLGQGLGIDHVVVFTPEPERAIALWRDQVGLRLALDRVFEQRKLRLIFFRSGGITLEYAHPLAGDRGAAGDGFYGVSYRVPNLVAHRERLIAAGFDVSELRPGMKPGSSVASVRDHTAEVPTLLIQQPTRGGA